MPVPPSLRSVEALIARVTLGLLMFFGVVSAIAVGFLIQHGSAAEKVARLGVPIAVIASSLLAFFLTARGRSRAAALLVVGTAFVAIVNYVVVGGYGLHSYSLAVLALLIVVTALLVGHRAGLLAAAIAVSCVLVLFWLERVGLVVDPQAVRAIPVFNIAILYVLLFSTVGAVLYMFSKAFHESLATAQAQELRFRALLEAAPMGYVIHRHGRILLANRITAVSNGYAQPEDMTGKPILDLLQKPDRHAGEARLAAALTLPAGSRLPPVDYPMRDRRGVDRLIETVTLRIDLADGPALLTQMRDVTDERAAAATLAEARDQAMAASRAKGDFVANMSHEIRTPLNAIVGLSQLVDDPALDASARRVYLDKVRAASQSLLEIVSDVLDVSKIEARALVLEHTHFDLRREIQVVEQVHGDLALDKGIGFSVQVAPELPQVLIGDPLRLRQVISNFVSNAIKFTPQGQVDLILGAAAPGRLRIEVRDTGIGVAEQVRGRLFQPFSQADNSTTRRYGGTGLGLSLCRQLVALMNGEVGVQARPDGGSVFWAEVPFLQGNAANVSRAEAAAGGADQLRGARVLLVEDNEVNRMVATAALERLGLTVATAGGGHEAIAKVQESRAQPYDAILMDIQMPDMDGYAATAELRRDYPMDRLPIIAMTAAALADDQARCLAAGMNDFISKPFDLRRLESVLRRWIAARCKERVAS